MYRSVRLPAALIGVGELAGLALVQNTPHVPPIRGSKAPSGTRSIPPSTTRDIAAHSPPGGFSLGVAPDGNVWTFNAYSPDGNLVKYFGRASPAPSRIPHGRLDKAGGLWLVDPRTHTIRKFTCGGEVPLTVGTPDESGEDATQLNQPNDVTQRRRQPNDVALPPGHGNS